MKTVQWDHMPQKVTDPKLANNHRPKIE